MTTESATLKLPRKLIVACDGTWQNSSDQWVKDGLFGGKGHLAVPTNVTRICRAIKPENSNKHPQVVYYQAGVGSESWSAYDQFMGGGLAFGLIENVREAYSFLVDNYLYDKKDDIKDEIYLLGFSRGAFTARSIGGIIASIGLLTKTALDNFYYIFEDYENAGVKGYKSKMAANVTDFKFDADPVDVDAYLTAFKAELIRHDLTRVVEINAIAVWDTVGTLGLPIQPWLQKLGLPTTLHKYRFNDTGISKYVKNAFHALALDEDRAAFQASVWEREQGNDVTNLKQCWFPGCHSNIGGGYTDQSQADLTLVWMISQLSPLLEFNHKYLTAQLAKTATAIDPSGTKPPTPWGLGTVYEALTFPTSLGGSALRTPDRYHRLIPQTGKPLPDLLNDTSEYFHTSVRARTQFGGKTQNLTTPYGQAKALKGWTLSSKKGNDGSAKWVWTYGPPNGDDKQCFQRELEEAPLSELELKILEKDPAMYAKLFPSDVEA